MRGVVRFGLRCAVHVEHHPERLCEHGANQSELVVAGCVFGSFPFNIMDHKG